jgi:hypothetical protein
MPEIPSFLKDFMDHRAHVTKKDKERPKMTTSIKKIDKETGGIQTIIEKKPGIKLVEEYFQKRCDELSVEKMK